MRIDKTQISGVQFMFTVTCFIQSSSLLTAFLSEITKQDSWLAVLFGVVVCLPLIWLYRTLMVMFPDYNLIQILEEVYSPVVGKTIGISYAWFFITLTALNLSDMGSFSKLTLMKRTPDVVLIVTCMLVMAWAVKYGIRLITQYSALFVFVAFSILIASVLLVLNQINLQNFLPMFDLPAIKYVQGTHIISTIPFGELVTLLMITPNVKLTRRDTTKYLFGGFTLGWITVLVVISRDIAVLGNTLPIFTLPTLVTLRLVNLGEALSRVEILFAIMLIMLLFFKITFLYYVSVITVAQIMKTKSYRHLILAAGALITAYSFTLYPSPLHHAASAKEITPILWTFFEILMPLLTFVIAKLRKLPKEKEV